MSEDRFYSVKELSELFRKHPETIKRWARKEKYGAIKRGGQWYFPKEKIL